MDDATVLKRYGYGHSIFGSEEEERDYTENPTRSGLDMVRTNLGARIKQLTSALAWSDEQLIELLPTLLRLHEFADVEIKEQWLKNPEQQFSRL